MSSGSQESCSRVGGGLGGWESVTLVEEGVCVCVIEVQWQAICSGGEE